MGSFGMVLGTVGLAIMLLRSIRERRYELALMSAAGYPRRKIRFLVVREYSTVLITGVLAGFLTAVFSTLPVYLSPDSEISLSFIGGLSAMILLNGMIWIWFLSAYQIRKLNIIEDLRNE
jgi:ABC-type antimicrobial peptide transport system permease subunit